MVVKDKKTHNCCMVCCWGILGFGHATAKVLNFVVYHFGNSARTVWKLAWQHLSPFWHALSSQISMTTTFLTTFSSVRPECTCMRAGFVSRKCGFALFVCFWNSNIATCQIELLGNQGKKSCKENTHTCTYFLFKSSWNLQFESILMVRCVLCHRSLNAFK